MTGKKRALGTSGIETIPLMLGGNVFGWTADREASFAVLDRFVELGGSLIDTADAYSAWIPGHRGGESEEMIGSWLKARGNRDQIAIATKVGMLKIDGKAGLRPEHIAHAAEASLRRLGIERIDLYFAHCDDPDVPQEDVLGAFDALVTAGKVGAIGASNFTVERLRSALAVSDANGLVRYTVLQPEYNLIERRFEVALQELCVREEIGVVPYFGLASGFLTGKYRSEADLVGKARGGMVRKYLSRPGIVDLLGVMDAVAMETGASHAAIALAWLHGRPAVVAPIASASNAVQLDTLIAATDLTLDADQVARLDAAGSGVLAET